MNRLFFRFFLLVMLSITLATFIVYAAISWLFGDPLEQNAARQAAPHIFLLEQYIDRAPKDEWLARLNKVREVSPIQLELLPLAQARAMLGTRQQARLQQGAVVLDSARKAFFRRVDLQGRHYVGSEEDVVYAHGLPIDDALALKTEALRFVIVALALLIPIALWSRAHWRGLQTLSSVADAVGQGNLAARAQIGPRASIYPLAQHINQMAGRIASLLGAQKSLLHAVSHELRTPIARLEFGMELLRDAAANPKLEQRIDAMQADLAELNSLVNELLRMAKLDNQGKLAMQAFDLGAILQGCCDALAHQMDATPISVACACQYAMGDERLLARALSNVLGNARKYAATQIHLSAQQDANGYIEIKIEDDGPGIPQAEWERVFEPFYRLDRSRDRNTGGFGLGLAIARQALVLHGGTVTLEHGSMAGACFVLRWPGVIPP